MSPGASVPLAGAAEGNRRALTVGLAAVAAVAAVGLTWAKWLPYAQKIAGLGDTRSWAGGALTRAASDAPTWWEGAWAFTVDYTAAVWKAMVVGLLLAAALEAFLPKDWLGRSLTRRAAWSGSVVAGAASLPSMMCTCCAAPVAVSLRRADVPTASAVAYWLGNPVLNPAVVVFLALVGPWEWSGVRLLVGVALVIAAAAAAARLAPPPPVSEVTAASPPVASPRPAYAGGPPSLRRFGGSLTRLSVTLLPEYAVVVFAVGAAAHLVRWDASWVSGGVLGILLVAAVAVLLVIPTGGEIPVLLALAAAGASPWVLGMVLMALPALSLPSMLMVGRALTWRVTAAAAGVVVLGGLVAGGALSWLA